MRVKIAAQAACAVASPVVGVRRILSITERHPGIFVGLPKTLPDHIPIGPTRIVTAGCTGAGTTAAAVGRGVPTAERREEVGVQARDHQRRPIIGLPVVATGRAGVCAILQHIGRPHIVHVLRRRVIPPSWRQSQTAIPTICLRRIRHHGILPHADRRRCRGIPARVAVGRQIEKPFSGLRRGVIVGAPAHRRPIAEHHRLVGKSSVDGLCNALDKSSVFGARHAGGFVSRFQGSVRAASM